MSKIELNKPVFDATLTQAQEASNQLKNTAFQPSISKTKLKSIEHQLNVLKELEKAITQYQQLLEYDLQVLKNTGIQLAERDTDIAISMKKT